MIKVYFESNSHAELVATFETEELYTYCISTLEKMAINKGMKLTESVEKENQESFVLTNDEGKIMSIIKGINQSELEEKVAQSIREDYDLQNVNILKSDLIDEINYTINVQLFYSDEEIYEEEFTLTNCLIY
jgi:hypothetical protein